MKAKLPTPKLKSNKLILSLDVAYFTSSAQIIAIASGVIKSRGKLTFLNPLISSNKKARLTSSEFTPFSSIYCFNSNIFL